MDELERAAKEFRGGTGRIHLSREDILETLSDIFGIASYQEIPLQSSSQPVDKFYSENLTFWEDALQDRQFQGMRVQLNAFHITEWLPLAPGRYYTPSAQEQRTRALHFYNDMREEYNLEGKSSMYLGGVGSVRLSAKTIESELVYFLGASSTGISHQGIPIALYESEYRQLIQIIKDKEHGGGCQANIVGTLKILPRSLPLIRYDRQVPKHCLVVDRIEVIGSSKASLLSTTVSVIFQLDGSRNKAIFFCRQT